eukprot:4746198-Pyramimonas_sp.AAC.3
MVEGVSEYCTRGPCQMGSFICFTRLGPRYRARFSSFRGELIGQDFVPLRDNDARARARNRPIREFDYDCVTITIRTTNQSTKRIGSVT